MIDPNTIEDVEDFDGENVLCFGIDTETKTSTWGWVHMEVLMESGREDIVRRFMPYDDDDDDEW